MGAVLALEKTVADIRNAFRVRKATMSYQEIADGCGVHPITLSAFNRGSNVSADVLRRIAAWLDMLVEVHHDNQ